MANNSVKTITAISNSRALVAVHSHIGSNNKESGNDGRFIVKCYDSKVSLGTLKFTLTANIDNLTKDENNENVNNNVLIHQLLFCGHDDRFLVAILNTNLILVWDIRRGVLVHTLSSAPNNSTLCCATTSDGTSIDNNNRESASQPYVIYALSQNIETSKLFVHVYDLEKDGKVIKKIKVGSPHDDDDDDTSVDLNDSSSSHSLMTNKYAISSFSKQNIIAVRTGKRIRICNIIDGKTSVKIKLKKISSASPYNVAFSSDGRILATTSIKGIHFYKVSDGAPLGDATYSSKSPSLSHHDHLLIQYYEHDDNNQYYITSYTAMEDNQVSLYQHSYDGDLVSQNPFATITTPLLNNQDGNDRQNMKIIHGFFPSISSSDNVKSDIIVVESSLCGLYSTNLQMGRLTFANYTASNSKKQSKASKMNSEWILCRGELYSNPSENNLNESDQSKNDSKKRKSDSVNTVIGPGESGGEKLIVTDATIDNLKRKKVDDTVQRNENNDDDDDDDEFIFKEEDESMTSDTDGSNKGATIAERLALLSAELDRETDDDDDIILDSEGSNKNSATVTITSASTKMIFSVKKATSESLVTLLRQALFSNDDSQLEVALQVSDKNVIENSIMALCSSNASISSENVDDIEKKTNSDGSTLVVALLSKLVTRLARKPSRAEALSFWIRTILVSLISPGSSDLGSDGDMMDKDGRDIASKLGPLRNLLSERAESLPQLLRLEGRLSLLGQRI
jgi:hypothetical protein